MRAAALLGVLLMAGCARVATTDQTMQRQSGLLVEKSQVRIGHGAVLRVSGAAWLFGGDASTAFDAEAAATARDWGCMRWRVDGRQESQESTVLGTRRVVQGTLICLP